MSPPCYKRGLDGIYEQVPCPGIGPTAPGEPTLQQGLSSIYSGIGLLSQACQNCNSCNCSVAQCASEAHAIGQALASAWQANYGQGPHGGAVPVAGWFCYDWTNIFQSAIERVQSNCFSTTIGAHAAGGGKLPDIHVWLIVSAGELNETAEDGVVVPNSECSVSFDNGYSTGISVAHPGPNLLGPDGTVMTGWPNDIGQEYYWRCTNEDEINPFPVWPVR